MATELVTKEINYNSTSVPKGKSVKLNKEKKKLKIRGDIYLVVVVLCIGNNQRKISNPTNQTLLEVIHL